MSHLHLLDSVHLKVARAEYHAKRFRKRAEAYAAKEPYSAVGKIDQIRNRAVYIAQVKEEPPDELRVVVGDCIHNLRAALDNLAYALAVRQSGSPPPNERSICFPIRDTPNMFPSQKNTGIVLGAMPPSARGVIESLQPYHRRKDPQRHPLWVLRDLDDFDKHRVLHVVNATSNRAAFQFSVPVKGVKIHHYFGPLENGTELAWFDLSDAVVDIPGGGPEVGVDLDVNLGFGISFDKAGPANGDGVTWLIEEELIPYVKKTVLPKFTKFFK